MQLTFLSNGWLVDTNGTTLFLLLDLQTFQEKPPFSFQS